MTVHALKYSGNAFEISFACNFVPSIFIVEKKLNSVFLIFNSAYLLYCLFNIQ